MSAVPPEPPRITRTPDGFKSLATCRTRTDDLRFTKPLGHVVSGANTDTYKRASTDTRNSPSSSNAVDPDLARIICVCPTLSQQGRWAILAIIETADCCAE